ncbi:hypothetical protein Bbelb_118960 [Branchiostoma belcheri]|nr:hypothetical protein Bbelb_118960 [Branchiostoma belcheri]
MVGVRRTSALPDRHFGTEPEPPPSPLNKFLFLEQSITRTAYRLTCVPSTSATSFTASGGTTSAFGRDTLGGGHQQADTDDSGMSVTCLHRYRRLGHVCHMSAQIQMTRSCLSHVCTDTDDSGMSVTYTDDSVMSVSCLHRYRRLGHVCHMSAQIQTTRSCLPHVCTDTDDSLVPAAIFCAKTTVFLRLAEEDLHGEKSSYLGVSPTASRSLGFLLTWVWMTQISGIAGRHPDAVRGSDPVEARLTLVVSMALSPVLSQIRELPHT